jgi:hypothetical protein
LRADRVCALAHRLQAAAVIDEAAATVVPHADFDRSARAARAAERGLMEGKLLEGVVLMSRVQMPRLFAECDQVWRW